MFISNLNEDKASLVCRYAHPYHPADYAAYHAAFARLVAAARTYGRPAVLIVDLEDGYPQANAVQRRDIGEAWAKAPDVGGIIAIITSSVLIRGIITAIEWLMKTTPTSRETRAFSRVTDAVTWAAEESGVDRSELSAAIEAVRVPDRLKRAAP